MCCGVCGDFERKAGGLLNRCSLRFNVPKESSRGIHTKCYTLENHILSRSNGLNHVVQMWKHKGTCNMSAQNILIWCLHSLKWLNVPSRNGQVLRFTCRVKPFIVIPDKMLGEEEKSYVSFPPFEPLLSQLRQLVRIAVSHIIHINGDKFQGIAASRIGPVHCHWMLARANFFSNLVRTVASTSFALHLHSTKPDSPSNRRAAQSTLWEYSVIPIPDRGAPVCCNIRSSLTTHCVLVPFSHTDHKTLWCEILKQVECIITVGFYVSRGELLKTQDQELSVYKRSPGMGR